MVSNNGARRYRDMECDVCHQILPADQMRTVSVTKKTGHTQGGSRSFGRRSNRSTVNYSARYRVVNFKVCPDCKDPKPDGQFGKWVILSLIGLAIVGGLVGETAGVRNGNSGDQVPALEATAAVVDNGRAEIAADSAVPAEATEDVPLPAPTGPVEVGGDQAPIVPQPASVFEQNAAALAEAAKAALKSGRAEMWSGDGVKGYVLPSPAVAEAGGQCRNLYAVATVAGVTTSSGIERFCEVNGVWEGSTAFKPE